MYKVFDSGTNGMEAYGPRHIGIPVHNCTLIPIATWTALELKILI